MPDRSSVAAAVWAFAEATVFFIVPDVLLTGIAITDLKRAMKASMWALPGALLGGLVMYTRLGADIHDVRSILDAVPAISPEMILAVSDSVREHGALALFVGPLIGTPYKIYAVEAANAGTPLWLFMLVSIPARLARFLILALVSGGISRLASEKLSTRSRYLILASVWTAFYAVYFYRMPN